jgi:chemotaxis protein histidine kinase CheA
MVVTFLLIIMSIALSVISQNVAKSFIESMAQKTAQGGGDIASSEKLDASSKFSAEVQPEKADPQAKTATQASSSPSQSQSESAAASSAAASSAAASSAAASSASSSASANDAPSDASGTAPEASESQKKADASFTPQLADELKSSQQANAGKEMAILSREVLKEEKRIVVAAPDRTIEEEAATRVERASTLLTLQFDPTGTRIDEATVTAVAAFFTENGSAFKDRPLVIWSFASAETASISEARRVAYYRALATRNELIKNGVTPENINVEIRFGESADKLNTVQVVATK